MQNEELRHAKIALEESRDQYIELYELAPVGYLTLDHEGVIEKANLIAANILGVECSKLIKRRLSSFAASEACDRLLKKQIRVTPKVKWLPCAGNSQSDQRHK